VIARLEPIPQSFSAGQLVGGTDPAEARERRRSMKKPPNLALHSWVRTVTEHALPERVHWWTGTPAERAELTAKMVQARELTALDPKLHPRSFLYRTPPESAGGIGTPTLVSTHRRVDAGPTNHWLSRDDAHRRLWPLFRGAMRRSTLYVVPYLLGPARSRFGKVGVELTDSPYVTLALDMMTRTGSAATDELGSSVDFARGLHCVARLGATKRLILHFPETVETWSIGSSNLQDGLFCSGNQGLRLASARAREEGWLAEHMSLFALTDPQGRTTYVAVAFADGCLASELAPPLSQHLGWKLEKLGGDSCWMRPGDDGRLWGVTPEQGLWQSVSELGMQPSPAGDALFTDVALRAGGRVWWEGQAALDAHESVEDWRGQAWTAQAAATLAAHPLAHCVLARPPTTAHPNPARSAKGVPVSAIVFCGRDARATPLVYEARSWRHGVYVGATLASEMPGAGLGELDPMAMLRGCGYNLGDYFSHWLAIGRKLHSPPKLFHVNQYREGGDGRRLWPGGRDNVRILRWIAERVEGSGGAQPSSLGFTPEPDSLELDGLDIPRDRLLQALSGNHGALLRQAERARTFLARFGDSLPAPLFTEHRQLVRRLQESLH
jgi:phosphoenolpyruvate carboxykinase (GTP)